MALRKRPIGTNLRATVFRRRVLQSTAALLFVFQTTLVFAEAESSKDTSERLIREGIELRREHDDYRALELFRQAHSLDPNPRAAAQLGFCEQAVGHWVDAELHLKAALDKGKTDKWIRANREFLEESLKEVRTHIGFLRVRGVPQGAQLFVNGSSVGTLPLEEPLRLNEGTYDVSASSEGYETSAQKATLASSRQTDLFFRLVKTPVASEPELASKGTAAASSKPSLEASLADSTAPEAVERTSTRWPWIAGGLAAVAGAVVLFFVLSGTEDPKCPDCSLPDATLR